MLSYAKEENRLYSTYYHLRGIISKYRFLLRFHFAYYISIAITILSIVIAIYDPPSMVFSLVATIVTCIFGIGFLIKDTFAASEKANSLYSVDPLSKLSMLKSLKLSDNYVGFRLADFGDGRVAYSPKLNQLLPTANLKFKLEGKFELDFVAKEIAPFAIKKAFRRGSVIFNDPKLRLKSDLSLKIENNQTLSLQRTSYFASICTNEMTCIEVFSKKDKSIKFDGLSFMSNNGYLLDLKQSRCSNHIGVNVVAFTNDGFMIIPIQTKETAQSPSTYVPSGSGSVDYKDFEQNPNAFIAAAMDRELAEECNINKKILKSNKQVIRTDLIGFARNLSRGGKPEFFGTAFIDLPFESLGIGKREAAFIADITKIRVNRSCLEKLKNDLAKYRKKNKEKMSMMLHVNLLFLEGYMESNPSRLLKLIGGNP